MTVSATGGGWVGGMEGAMVGGRGVPVGYQGLALSIKLEEEGLTELARVMLE